MGNFWIFAALAARYRSLMLQSRSEQRRLRLAVRNVPSSRNGTFERRHPNGRASFVAPHNN
jgi:hypothetical protein